MTPSTIDKPRTIVAAVRDEGSGRIAVERARTLLRRGDRMLLAHVPRTSLLSVLGRGPIATREHLERWLDDLARAPIDYPATSAEVEILEGTPATAIAELASRVSAAAIVVAPHREGMVRELLVGSTTLRLLRRTPCPVLVARRTVEGRYQQVDAAVDADGAGQRVVAVASALLAGAKLTLLHAYRLPQEGQMRMRGVSEPELESLRHYLREDVERRLQPVRALAPEAALELRYGYAATEVLCAVAERRADVLVLSRHRGSEWEERALGSVTQYLLYNCPIDLLIVP